MNKFSKIFESNDSKYFKAKSKVDIIIEASNDGESAYKADLLLASIDGQCGYNIDNIVEIDKEEFISLKESKNNYDKIIRLYENSNIISLTDKLEFYHNLRNQNIDRNQIVDFFKEKNI